MPIEFSCPKCGHHTVVADAFGGQSGPCSACGAEISIPTRDEVVGTAAYRPARPKLPMTLVTVGGVGLIGLALLGLLGALLVPLMNQNHNTAEIAEASSRLRQIGLAMLAYENDYSQFPPAYTVDEDGNPMHSWRVLLLPYLGEQSLYSRYRFDEPYHSAHNRMVCEEPLDVYTNPNSEWGYGMTNFMVVVGEKTMFPPDGKSRQMAEVRDGLTNTILVVEVEDMADQWSDPVDLDFDAMPMRINDDMEVGISSATRGGAVVVMADGSTRRLPNDTLPSAVRSALTINGGETNTLP